MRRTLLVLPWLAFNACSVPATEDRVLPVQMPFLEARVFDHHLYVRLGKGVPLSTVVTVDLGPITPGMTLEQARAVAGPPLSTRVGRDTTYYRFQAPAKVEVAHLTGPTSGGRLDKWVVVAAPGDNAVSAFLSPEFWLLLHRAGSVGEITVHEHQRPQLSAFTAKLREGRLFHAEWYSIQGIPGG